MLPEGQADLAWETSKCNDLLEIQGGGGHWGRHVIWLLETLRLIDTYRISREEMNIFLLSIKN
jgi:hypothetical protein